jgi:DNA-binding Lrp family transcriptional regulator
MLSFSGGGNVCFPSYKKIAEDLNISEPTIAKSLKKLNELKYIKTEKLYPNDKLKHNNKYTLSFLTEATILNDIKSHAKPAKVSRLAKLSSNNNILNNNILNNNISNNNIINIEKQPILNNDSIIAHAENVNKSIVKNWLQNGFEKLSEEINKNKYYHDVKEAKAIDVIYKRMKNKDEEVKLKLKIFYENCTNPPNDFWAGISCTPSMFLSLWNRLVPSREVSSKQLRKSTNNFNFFKKAVANESKRK